MQRIESPRLDDEGAEQVLAAKAVAPRVTLDDLERAIVGEQFLQPEGTTLTICVLTLRNGFTVTGESAAASPENFDADIGRRFARQKARDAMWPLLGYALKERLAATPTDFRERVRIEHRELAERTPKLAAFIQSDAFKALDESDQGLLTDQYEAMVMYQVCLERRIAKFGG